MNETNQSSEPELAVSSLKLGSYYHSKEVRKLGGGEEMFFPYKGEVVYCGRFNLSLNPDAPWRVLIGKKPLNKKSAELFQSQNRYIPVFLNYGDRKDALNWQYVGSYMSAGPAIVDGEKIEEEQQRIRQEYEISRKDRPITSILALKAEPGKYDIDEVRKIIAQARSEHNLRPPDLTFWPPRAKHTPPRLPLDPPGHEEPDEKPLEDFTVQWQESVLQQQIESAETDGSFVPNDLSDALQKSMREVTLRWGQSQFRSKLLNAYDHKCAISGCTFPDLLEAAHIHPYSVGGEATNHASNGVLLRADLHTLFDLHHFAIDPKHHTAVFCEALKKQEPYRALHGRKLAIRKDGVLISEAAITQHHKRFMDRQKLSERGAVEVLSHIYARKEFLGELIIPVGERITSTIFRAPLNREG